MFPRVLTVSLVQRALPALGVTEPRHAQNTLNHGVAPRVLEEGQVQKHQSATEGKYTEMRTKIKAWLWAWAVILRHRGRTQLNPGKSSLPGSPVTDLEAGQQREDSFRVCVQRVQNAIRSAEGGNMVLPVRGLTPASSLTPEGQGSVCFVPGPVPGAEDRETNQAQSLPSVNSEHNRKSLYL